MYVTLFWTNFDPISPPVILCHTSWAPHKVRHTSRTPHQFLVVQKNPYKISLNCSWGLLFGGFCLGSFVRGWFLSVPPCVRIHPLQQKVKHFQFQFSYV